jgi:predicted aldo/keto reductase-like oxidoreductase
MNNKKLKRVKKTKPILSTNQQEKQSQSMNKQLEYLALLLVDMYIGNNLNDKYEN